MTHNCECCGEPCEEFGDVRGAIVCLYCMETDPGMAAEVAAMEEEFNSGGDIVDKEPIWPPTAINPYL